MTSLKKKILAGVLSGTIFLTGGLALSNVEAANSNDKQNIKFSRHRERPNMSGNPDRKFDFGRNHERRPMTDEQVSEFSKAIADRYGVNQSEVATALKDDTHFGDIKHAAMLSKLSGKSFTEVLAMKSDWKQVADKLGVSSEQLDSLMQDERLEDLSKISKLDKKIVNDLLNDNYDPRDICMAGLIANESGKNAKTIIAKRKINNSWEDIAKEYNVDLGKLMEQNRPPRGERGDRD